MPRHSLKLLLAMLLLAVLSLKLPLQAQRSKPVHIVLLTPRNDAFWTLFYEVTQAAAEDLDVRLEWLPAMNDPARQLQDATAVLQRKHDLPDAIIYKNFEDTAVPILKLAEQAGVVSMMFEESLTSEQMLAHGRPREKFKLWLGDLLPDQREAGFNLCEVLVEAAKQQGRQDKHGRIQMLALGGNMNEASSYERVEGLQIALQRHPEVLLHEITAGFWKEPVAYAKMKRLLEAYPETQVIWAPNDTMPVGARRAALELKRQPLIGGIGTTPPAAQDLYQGKVNYSIGGHYLMGPFIVVMLYDYLNGYDFASESTMMRLSLFTFDRQNVKAFAETFQQSNWRKVDFRRFSKALNPELKKYNFGFQPIMQQFSAK